MLRGASDAAERQRQELAAAAVNGGPVILIAEDGLEPEAVARALHAMSGGGPFTIVDCAAPAADLHAQLFGGPEPASSRRRDLEPVGRRGALLATGGGTLALADAVELPAAVQRRLARVLRDGEVYVAGTRQPSAIRVRLVAIVSPDVEEEVAAARFRTDLYRRLSTRRIALAPLRTRAEDIPEMVRALAGEVAGPRGALRTFTPAALTALAALPWNRNLDELRAFIDRLHRAAPGTAARQEDVLKQIAFGGGTAPARFDSLRDARKRFEREYIAAVLSRHQWRIPEAAETLGIERANLYRKIRQLRLSRPSNGAS